jgi:O-succinylbenzoic acid--CoA ligase
VWPVPDRSDARVAVETPTASLSYGELAARSRAAAAELGVGRGERVGIALPPGIDFAIALHACFTAGAVAVPIDLRVPPERRPVVAVLVDQPLDGHGARGVAIDLGLDDVAAVIGTSGSTGEPKEVPLTFGNFVWSALGSAVALGLDPDERWLCTLPLSHVGGLSILVRSWLYGTTAVVHERFETQAAIEALMTGGVTLVSVVATTLTRLLDAGLERPPALRCALLGGGPIPPGLVERARVAGVPVSKTYGLTEACSQVASQAPGDGEGGVPPLFCTRVGLASDGEILVSGPTVSPALTQPLHTGDLGEIDAGGALNVIGRKADTIISGGENIAPGEVEAALETHPEVVEAGVYGVPDAEWGEAVWAAVVVRSPVAESELRAYAAQRLPRFAAPKRIRVVAALPRTASGKLRRRELRDL